MGLERFQLSYDRELTRSVAFPLITTFKACWYHDGISPTSLGYIAFRFAFTALHSITRGIRPDDVNASYTTVMAFLGNYERKVLDFIVPR